MNHDTLIKMMHGQARSANLWISQWERYKDTSGVRNAALAIGKIMGMYFVLDSMVAASGEEVPEEIHDMMRKYNDIWDQLHISKTVAGAIAKSG